MGLGLWVRTRVYLQAGLFHTTPAEAVGAKIAFSRVTAMLSCGSVCVRVSVSHGNVGCRRSHMRKCGGGSACVSVGVGSACVCVRAKVKGKDNGEC